MKKKFDVCFYEVFKEEEKVLKKYLPNNIKASFLSETIQEKKEKNLPSALISIRTQSLVPREWVSDLKGILTRSQGYDHLLKYDAGSIALGYLQNYCSRAVAEQAIMIMMLLLRKAKKQIKHFDTFNRDGLTGHECKNKKVLIVGVGKIGSLILDIAKGLKMKVKGVDIIRRKKNIQYIPLSAGIKWADIIFSAVPLTEKTRCMFNYDLFNKSTNKKFFINISRGEVFKWEDFDRLLKENKFLGAGFDVYENEHFFADELRKRKKQNSKIVKTFLKLSKMDNVIFTPHNAFNTQEALHEKAKQTTESIAYFLKKNKFINQVYKE